MADKPTGPVKPPTLDLKARKPETASEATPGPAAPDTAPKPGPTPPPTLGTKDEPSAQGTASPREPLERKQAPGPDGRPAPALPIMPFAAAGLGGAALGLAAAYGLALAGLWPASTPSGLAALEPRIARVENTLAASSTDLADLGSRLGALEAAPTPDIPALPENLLTTDALAGITGELDALGLRIDAVAAGMPGEESAGLAAEIARLGSSLADIETRLDQPDTAFETLSADLAALAARLETLEARAADQAAIDAMRAERDRFASLPGATAALEIAIASGAPFGAELAGIETLVPELGVTNPARAIAAGGIKPMRQIARDFRGLIPALLAAKPADPQAGWLDTLLGQAQSAIALRPVDDGSDTPEAMIGRIEAALENGDATTARTLLLSLPETMQQVAAPVRTDLDATIAAEALIADIRALAPQGSEAGQ